MKELFLKFGMLPKHANTDLSELTPTKLTKFVENYPVETPHSLILLGIPGIGKNTALGMLAKRFIEYNKTYAVMQNGDEKILVRRMPKFIYSWVGVKPYDLDCDLLIMPNVEECPFIDDLPGILAQKAAKNPLFLALMSSKLLSPVVMQKLSDVCTIYRVTDVKQFQRKDITL